MTWGRLIIKANVSVYTDQGLECWNSIVSSKDHQGMIKDQAEEWGVNAENINMGLVVLAYPSYEGVEEFVFDEQDEGCLEWSNETYVRYIKDRFAGHEVDVKILEARYEKPEENPLLGQN